MQNQRTEILIGENGVKTLSQKSVLIVGVGGVGGYVCEMLARCGVGRLTLVDFDKVDITNINRQIFFYNLLGTDKYESEKEYFTIEIHNTGATTAILNINDSNFTLKYKKYLGTFDGKEKYEDDRYKIELSSIVKRKSIAAGESMYIIIDSILLYNTTNWKIYTDINVENFQVIYRDLFNYEYKDICRYENGKIIPINDNQLIQKQISEN